MNLDRRFAIFILAFGKNEIGLGVSETCQNSCKFLHRSALNCIDPQLAPTIENRVKPQQN
jgi:hypothetical protein